MSQKAKFIKKIFKKTQEPVFVGIVTAVALGFVLRVYRFKDFLFFALDQARNWLIVKNALVGGIEELPLLGPRAGGTFFRLGPAYNYIEFLAARLFGASPEKLAIPVLFFNSASIAVFYYFLRQYFARWLSLALIFLYAVGLFGIEFSRFSWNPNLIAFFSILLFLGLLKVSQSYHNRSNNIHKYGLEVLKRLKRLCSGDKNLKICKSEKELEQNSVKIVETSFDRSTWVWLILASISFGVLIQLHGLAMLLTPIIVLGYLLISKTGFKLKQLSIALLIVVLVNLPCLLNDVLTNFGNSRALIRGYLAKSQKNSEYTWEKKVLVGFHEISRNYFTIITSSEKIRELDQTKRNEGVTGVISRNAKSVWLIKNMVFSAIFLGFIGFAFYILVKDYWRLNKKKNQKARQKANFILLILIWQAVYAPVLIMLAIKADSRYYLGLIFLPYVLIGVVAQKLEKNNKLDKKLKPVNGLIKQNLQKMVSKKVKSRFLTQRLVIGVGLAGLFLINLKYDLNWLGRLEQMDKQNKDQILREYILEDYYFANWGQLEQIINLIEQDYLKKNQPIAIEAGPYYQRSVAYVLEFERGLPVDSIKNDNQGKELHYYLIDDTKDPEKRKQDLPSDLKRQFEVSNYQNFGTLTLFRLNRTQVREKQESKNNKEPADKDLMPKKFKWEELLN
ncbi:MAG: hypothetical protein GF332_04680 [Candidatus Moranbacteria bacterium]|nr:hypothetical protein [Candidatus Moranbacteria bacterium]